MTRFRAALRVLTADHAPYVARFAAVGLLNTALDFGVFSALHYVYAWNVAWANLASYSLGIGQSFFLNRHWTYARQGVRGRVGYQLPLFVLLNLGGLGVSTLTVWGLAQAMPAVWAKVFAVGLSFAWNYLTTRYLVYRPASRLPPSAEPETPRVDRRGGLRTPRPR